MSPSGIVLTVICAVMLIGGGAILIAEPLTTLTALAGIADIALCLCGLLFRALASIRLRGRQSQKAA